MVSEQKDEQLGRPRSVVLFKVALWITGTLGLLCLGGGLGQLFWPAQVTQQVVVQAPIASTDATALDGQFPHVLGLDESTARSAIASAGFVSPSVTLVSKPAAGPEKYVVAQQPDPGSVQPLAAVKATLTLSRAVDMPNLIGKSADAARQEVAALYGVPQLIKVTTADAAPGIVLSTDPPAGGVMPVEVTIRVSDGGQSLSLTELSSVGASRCSTGKDMSINGQVQAQGLACYPGTNDRPAYVEYAIGRHATYLESTVGMLDTATKGKAAVRILGDGKVLATINAEFGDTVQLHVTVRNVLRLRLEVTGPAAEGGQPRLVLGNIRIVGNPDDLDQIEG